jgi:hypothetical protein
MTSLRMSPAPRRLRPMVPSPAKPPGRKCRRARLRRQAQAGGTRCPRHAPAANAPKGRIDAPGVLSDFDEDADFDHDPEVEAQLASADPKARRKAARDREADLADPTKWWTQPGFPGFRAGVVMAGCFAIAGTVLAGVNASDAAIWRSLFMLYQIVLHVGTGMLAVLLAAVMSARRINEPMLAAARVAVAVGAFHMGYALNITLLPGKFEELVVGAMGYVLVLLLMFRLPRYELGVMAIAHASFWVLVEIGWVLVRQIPLAGSAG